MSIFRKAFILVFLVGARVHSADDCPTMLRKPNETKTLGELRVRAIRGWDRLLTWALTPKNRGYVLEQPLVNREFQVNSEDLFEFVKNYGYFSTEHPIVGIVTDADRDIKVTNCLLQTLPQDLDNPLQLQFSQDEILAKVIAYRPLKKGMKIDLGAVVYKVDEVLDLWKGMPAFGLIADRAEYPPILLYRGTDLNLVSEKGWASVLSDLDVNGPGHATFLRAHKTIQGWLKKMEKTPPRLVGFSLGGVFVLYTLIHDPELVNKQALSVAFNPPGVSREMFARWQQIPEEKRPPHHSYVNQGDFVSQIGFFLSDVWEVSLSRPMDVIEAHVTLISGESAFSVSAVDVEKDNLNRE